MLEVKHAPGKVPLISGSDLKRLKQQLQESSGFQSYGEIQQWLKSELGVSLAYKTVYEVVRNRLGAKLKVPRPQSTKQHSESLSDFKKNFL
ncbi:MAG: winged helix-turn-helix domain-containing protein [Nostoc sp.]